MHSSIYSNTCRKHAGFVDACLPSGYGHITTTSESTLITTRTTQVIWGSQCKLNVLVWLYIHKETWSESMFLFRIPVYWDGAPLSPQVFLWHRKEWADFCAGTCWKQTPVCPGWMPDRAPAPCRPPPPKWQRHWLGEIKMRRGKKTVSNVWLLPINNTKKSECISTSEGKMWG